MKSSKFLFLCIVLILAVFIAPLFSQSASQIFQQGLLKENGEGDLKAALVIYEKIVGDETADRSLRAKAQLHIGQCYEKLGLKEAQKAYQQVIDSYPEQTEAVKIANEKLFLLLRAEVVIRKEDKEFNIRQVWSDYELYSQGAPSPDGRYISYVHWDTGDLGILEMATGKKRRLTNKGTWDESDEFAEYSRWSADGKQIVYDWYNEKGFIELRIIGLDDSRSRILYRNEEVEWARTYGWSPDGKQILACFSRKDGPEQIVLVSTDDSSVRVLKILEKGWPKNINFSPDGRYIVYDFPQKENSPERDISLLSTDGSREIPLVEHPADDFVLGWAPNGKNILFASDRTGTLGAWLIAVADGKPQGTPELVKSDIGRFSTMGFTRDGSFYYHFGGEFIYDVYFAKLDPETGEILVPPKKAIKNFEGYNRTPDYSPDGKYLAYIRRIRQSDVLCIHSLETGQEREFSPKLKQIELPRWSPDCSSILVTGRDFNNRWGIYQIDTQTGDVTSIVLSGGSEDWSHDGKDIFYVRMNYNNLSQIMLREIESGTEKEIYLTSDDDRLYLSCSPDGKWLAFINWEKGVLRIIPAAGGEPRELCRLDKGEGFGRSITWTPDGKYILFVISPPGNSLRQPEQNKCSLWRIPIDGGEPEKLGLEMNYISHFSIHPDGQHIALFTITDKLAEVWVMENFLPE
jgi:Tol biopolymer transport system component